MKIPESIIQDIREHVNIVDVIGDYMTLEKKGKNYFGCCPFHNEDTPSFSVSEEKQIFYCFGCHESGNVFSFPMKHEGLSFQEAVLKVATYTNIDVQQLEQQVQHQQTAQLADVAEYELMQFVAEFYEYLLSSGANNTAQKYLNTRQITQKETKQFSIGCATHENILYTLLKEKGYSIDIAKDLGLLFEGKNMLDYFDAFRNRIVFPIKNMAGQVVAFTGRLITADEQSPKYFHSPESKIFHKREILYNYSDVENIIRQKKQVYICEGIFDVIALAKANIPNAVASLGTAITKEQLLFLHKKGIKVTFVFDNDNAGKKALASALELALSLRMNCSAVVFWEYEEKDLDELLMHTTQETIQAVIDNELPVFDYFLKFYQQLYNLDNNEDRQEFTRKMMAILSYGSVADLDFYKQKIQEITSYSDYVLQTISQEVETTHTMPDESYPYPSDMEFQTPIGMPKVASNKPNKQLSCEELLIKGLTQGESYIKLYQNNPILTNNLQFRKIVYELLEYYRVNRKIDISALFEKLSAAETVFLTQSIYRVEPVDIDVFAELLEELRGLSEQTYYQNELKNSMLDVNRDKQVELLQEYMEFKKNKIKGD